jgi:small-conductance mechanosensitive channel
MDITSLINQILTQLGLGPLDKPENVTQVVLRLLEIAAILLAAYIVARILSNLTQRALTRANADPRIVRSLTTAVFYGILALGLVIALGGVTLALLLFVVIAGLAANDILKNFASGLQILSTRPFAVGDWILVNTFEGTVVSIGWRGTVLDTFDGRRVILPNSQVVTSAVVNNSAHQVQRLEAPFTVVSDADFAAVERATRAAALSVEGVLSEPAPQVLVTTLSGAAMTVVARFWLTAAPMRQRAILSEVMVAIREGLRDEGIALAPPPAPPPAQAAAPAPPPPAQPTSA